ncbi:MAG: D-aminoacyl-tRNA deacylase [Akkermansiaceae bacterium]|jgi:D-aminoacyl-tRNA deacylase
MRVVMQRVTQASVTVDEKIVSKIDQGLLILLGIEDADTSQDVDWLIGKICKMRIFDDVDGKMNLSLMDTAGESLVVSQFTLHANVKKGNRPSFIRAARPEKAIPLYEEFCSSLSAALGKKVGQGIFGAMMSVDLTNDGPVTILIDSQNRE